MRDWTKTLPNAFFRGVPLYVEEDSFTGGGRRVAVHEFVKSEDHDTQGPALGLTRVYGRCGE